MNRRKTFLILTLTAILIMLCSTLPYISAFIMDKHYEGGFAQVSPVQLQLRSSVSMLDRLAIQSYSTRSIEISEELTAHSADDVMTFAALELERYRQAGIIEAPDLDVRKQTISCESFIVLADGVETAKSNIIWTLRILHDDEEPPLCVTIDDETGKLLCIQYEYTKGIQYDPDTALHTLVQLYFSGLGEEVPQVRSEDIINTMDGPHGNQQWSYYWHDDALGISGIRFTLWEYGIVIDLE